MPEREIPIVRPDTDALKAMSHPVRLRMLGMLRSDGPATASQLAARLGLNSGATSYHLRQLADYGLIEDDPGRGSKRDRWWRAAHQSTQTDLADLDDPTARAANMAFWRVAAGEQVRLIQEAFAELDELPREWADASGSGDWQLRLTPTEARALVGRLEAILDKAMGEDPDEASAPEGAEQFVIQVHGFPRPGRLVHRDGDES